MANPFEINTTGFKEVAREFNRIGEDVQKKILRKAARAAGKPILATARELVPVRTGKLKRDLGMRVRRAGFLAVIAEIGTKGKAFWAHLVEFGHAIPGGGTVAAKPFIRPAFDQNIIKSIDAANNVFRKELILKRG